VDCDEKRWPYEDSSFDVVYTKSFIEHLSDPKVFLDESFRVLKSGGKIITLTPDWETNFKKFYDDCTHKRLYNVVSLKGVLQSHGFQDIEVFKFRQLPITRRFRVANLLPALLSFFCTSSYKN